MKELRIVGAIARLENAKALDPLVSRLQTIVASVVRPGPVKDLAHGVPFGHPTHPLAVQIPLGAWTSAVILDFLPFTKNASRALVGVGVLAAGPAAFAGWVDWSDLHEQQTRVGLVHAAGNLTATTLFGLSYLQRARGRTGSGKLLSLLGLTVVSGAGFLGGHLSYRQAAGANHVEDVPHLFPSGWQQLGDPADFPDEKLTRRVVADVPLLVHRRGDQFDVLADTCSHLSGPLNEGEVTTDAAGEACVTCPWHASVFRLSDGAVVHGPATSPQPSFETRLRDGAVEVLLPHAG